MNSLRRNLENSTSFSHPDKAEKFTNFVIRNFSIIAFLFLCSSFILPIRADLSVKYRGSSFYIENFLWLFLVLSSGYSLFESRTTERPPRVRLPGLIVVVLLAISYFFHETGQSIVSELDWWTGRCGIIIGIISLVSGVGLFHWASSQGNVAPRSNGLLAGFSSAGLGSLFMQFVCAQDSSNHLLVWHFIPLFFVSILGLVLGSVFLSRNSKNVVE